MHDSAGNDEFAFRTFLLAPDTDKFTFTTGRAHYGQLIFYYHHLSGFNLYLLFEPHHEKTVFLHIRKQSHRSAAQSLISTFVFTTQMIQSLCFLNPKFQASNHLLRLYSPICVGPGRKPRRQVFSWRGSFYSIPPSEQFPSGIAAFPWSMLYDSSKSNIKVLTGTIYSFVNVNCSPSVLFLLS